MWKLKEGDAFYLQGAMKLEQTFTVMGREVEQEMDTETVVRYKVKATKPGSTVVEMTYLSNKTTAKGLPGADAVNGKLVLSKYDTICYVNSSTPGDDYPADITYHM